ncbi:MAG TPA: sigma-70 family RNA polymerase sigma factor [Blastocatellia bacterium]|nr:sigma-70 family RNA polymerase sigma factor [Blastocatellia bacterium]
MQNELTINLAAISAMAERREDEQGGPAAPAALASLVARARGGEADAFEEIILLYQRQVLGIAGRLLGNSDDARDAAQEVFLRLHKYLHRFDEERALSPWLYRVTVNVCRDIGRRRRSGSTLSLEQEHEQGRLDHLAAHHDVEGEIGRAQEKQIIAAALATLPEKERAAVVLRDIVGLETREVARILRTSESTVRSQISMARVRIKRYRDKVLGRGK